jgi:hypothetical protein
VRATIPALKTALLGVVLLLIPLLGTGSTGATENGSPDVPQTAQEAISPVTLPGITRGGLPPRPVVVPGLSYDQPEAPVLTPREVCEAHPDRYDWRPYALAAGFPEWVLPELAQVIHVESRGDLCAVNKSSGATCWIQQYPGGEEWLDPERCMAQGFYKWEAGGRSFEPHWYRWW